MLHGDRLLLTDIRTETATGTVFGPRSVGQRRALPVPDQLQGTVRTDPDTGVAADAAPCIEHRHERMERRSRSGGRRRGRPTAEQAPLAGVDTAGAGQRPGEGAGGKNFELERGDPTAAQETCEPPDGPDQGGGGSGMARAFATGSFRHHQQPYPLVAETGEIPQARGVQAGDPCRCLVPDPAAGEEGRRPASVFAEKRLGEHLEGGLRTDRRTEAAAVAATGIEPHAPPIELQRITGADGDAGHATGGEVPMVETTFATEPRWRVAGRRPGPPRASYHPGPAPGR